MLSGGGGCCCSSVNESAPRLARTTVAHERITIASQVTFTAATVTAHYLDGNTHERARHQTTASRRVLRSSSARWSFPAATEQLRVDHLRSRQSHRQQLARRCISDP